MTATTDYRTRFLRREDAEEYDNAVYRAGSVHDLLWKIEFAILSSLVDELCRYSKRVDYLDFACGTGRILASLEHRVDSATGIDVSDAMLLRARDRVANARLYCRDITCEDTIEAQYDLITSFRFLTNAEPTLRAKALRALAKRLRNRQSALIINIHANPLSYKSLMVPLHYLRHKVLGAQRQQNLTRYRVKREIEDAGLRVERVIGLGFVSDKIVRMGGFRFWLWLEGKMAGLPVVDRLGVNQVFVCRLR